MFGDPEEIRARLGALHRSASVFSSSSPRLIDDYADKWVAVHDGAVKANADTLPELLTLVDQLELSREEILVRFIEENQRALIL